MSQELKPDRRLVALFPNRQVAEQACNLLAEAGIPFPNVNIRTTPEHTPPSSKNRLLASLRGGTIAGIGFGAITALLIYIGAMEGGATSGVFANPVFAPWMMGLTGSLVGAMMGALIGLATGAQVPSEQAIQGNGNRAFRRYCVTAEGTEQEIEQALLFLRQQGFQV
jgi:hypothetical protein